MEVVEKLTMNFTISRVGKLEFNVFRITGLVEDEWTIAESYLPGFNFKDKVNYYCKKKSMNFSDFHQIETECSRFLLF